MFRGLNTVSVDAKGRLAIPARFRETLSRIEETSLVLTLNPWDRALWLYPLAEWNLIDIKLASLSDFDKQSRRTKQIMRGYATDLGLDGQGRILLPAEMRDLAEIKKQSVLLGQGNKLEIWNADNWQQERDAWLDEVGDNTSAPAAALEILSL